MNQADRKIIFLMSSCIIMGGLGVYYIYLKGTGGLSFLKAAVIGALISFLACVFPVIGYFDSKKRIKKNDLNEPQKSKVQEMIRESIILIVVFGLTFVFFLFFVLRHLLKG